MTCFEPRPYLLRRFLDRMLWDGTCVLEVYARSFRTFTCSCSVQVFLRVFSCGWVLFKAFHMKRATQRVLLEESHGISAGIRRPKVFSSAARAWRRSVSSQRPAKTKVRRREGRRGEALKMLEGKSWSELMLQGSAEVQSTQAP